MLSIREELQKLAPVDLKGGAPASEASEELPADLVREWQRISAGIADIAAGQRKSAEQLEGFLQSVRSAAAEAQRTAASSREFLEDQRGAAEKERVSSAERSQKALAEVVTAAREQGAEAGRESVAAVQGSISAIAGLMKQNRASVEEVRALIERVEGATAARESNLEAHLLSSRQDIDAVVEPLAATALDFREIAGTLKAQLEGVSTLESKMREDARAIRDAVSEELRHRHEELERLQVATGRTHEDFEKMRVALLGSVAEMFASWKSDVSTAREAVEATLRADAERSEDQLRAISTSMMAFLEALDDVSALPLTERDPAARNTLGRLTVRAQRVLQAAGLTEIEAEGAALDEELHEVVERIPASATSSAGRVIKVVQRGFRSADRVLRRAQVVVAEDV